MKAILENSKLWPYYQYMFIKGVKSVNRSSYYTLWEWGNVWGEQVFQERARSIYAQWLVYNLEDKTGIKALGYIVLKGEDIKTWEFS